MCSGGMCVAVTFDAPGLRRFQPRVPGPFEGEPPVYLWQPVPDGFFGHFHGFCLKGPWWSKVCFACLSVCLTVSGPRQCFDEKVFLLECAAGVQQGFDLPEPWRSRVDNVEWEWERLVSNVFEV